MQNLLLLFARVGNLILFIFLQILCIYLIVNFNQSQREIFVNSSSIFSASMLKKMTNFREFVSLGKKNERLADENSRLLEELINLKSLKQIPINTSDSIRRYQLIPAAVINNSVVQKNNKITLDKGARDGIKLGMGVVNAEGLVGIINKVSSNFSTAISLLNLQTSISVKLRRSREIGELNWDGRSIRKMTMSAVPSHASVQEGDSVITSGFSTIFPEDLYVGKVITVQEDKRSGFLSLDVELNNDLSKLEFVYVIENISRQEQLDLEEDDQ